MWQRDTPPWSKVTAAGPCTQGLAITCKRQRVCPPPHQVGRKPGRNLAQVVAAPQAGSAPVGGDRQRLTHRQATGVACSRARGGSALHWQTGETLFLGVMKLLPLNMNVPAANRTHSQPTTISQQVGMRMLSPTHLWRAAGAAPCVPQRSCCCRHWRQRHPRPETRARPRPASPARVRCLCPAAKGDGCPPQHRPPSKSDRAPQHLLAALRQPGNASASMQTPRRFTPAANHAPRSCCHLVNTSAEAAPSTPT